MSPCHPENQITDRVAIATATHEAWITGSKIGEATATINSENEGLWKKTGLWWCFGLRMKKTGENWGKSERYMEIPI